MIEKSHNLAFIFTFKKLEICRTDLWRRLVSVAQINTNVVIRRLVGGGRLSVVISYVMRGCASRIVVMSVLGVVVGVRTVRVRHSLYYRGDTVAGVSCSVGRLVVARGVGREG